ncbi:gamma-glutamyltransferase [Streptomyces millisiae]|uniref:Gamma-glutamyltransferase n=1 Tax=Streptomyces millisiae TaxID=3075542 RepID=A0ABU2LMM2_9ACTN|nr:gamma-glutamyltransferase [Streptomyces sp. DSM 44918]MDT0318477.1 gamma-glutamyltransferase [Streptomyces sp. DSM 44918]
MILPHVTDAPPLVYTDSFDIPVLLRDRPARRPHQQWRTAKHKPWPAMATFPQENGWYAPTTTWREIIKAAIEVGRPVSYMFHRFPRLANSELVARVAPLYAYMGQHDVTPRHPLPQTVGRRLTLNGVYEDATERTAKNAMGYRLGMTMAEWACRALLGLAQTWHVENGGPIPALRGDFQDPKRKLPDLWGLHQAENQYWLIEAKGGDVGQGALDNGLAQLAGGSKILSAYAHRRVLIGAAVRPRDDLFLTIDHNQHAGGKPLTQWGPAAPVEPGGPEDYIGDSDDALMATARAQMLNFLALRSLPPTRLRTVLVATDRTLRRHTPGTLAMPLERDTETFERRARLRAEAPAAETPTLRGRARAMGLEEFLTGRIPGTEVTIGMSRRLFAACELVHRADLETANSTPGLRAEDQRYGDDPMDEEFEGEERRGLRGIWYERQEEESPYLKPVVRRAYERAEEGTWRGVLGTDLEPRLDVEPDAGRLEAATAETYVAVRGEGLPHST